MAYGRVRPPAPTAEFGQKQRAHNVRPYTAFTNGFILYEKRDRSGTCPFRLSEKFLNFSDSLKNADTFPPLRGGKVLAALAERLAKQGVQGI